MSKNRQAVGPLKLIINSGVEADLKTAQAFEKLSAGLTGAVKGGWQVDGADQATGLVAFHKKGVLWQRRRALARDFWTDGRIGA